MAIRPDIAEARRLDAEGRGDAAVEAILAALAADAGDLDMKLAAARLIQRVKPRLDARHAPALHALLVDPDINPDRVEHAGWLLIEARGQLALREAEAAAWLESDAFARDLLTQTSVTSAAAEQSLTLLRRWLLLSDRHADFPQAAAALVRQAAHNGGAWLFDAEERALLSESSFAPAYLPPRPAPAAPLAAGDFTRAVAGQYEAWPYPVWTRTDAGTGDSLTRMIAALGPGAPQDMAEDASVLFAGCGTGHEPISWARRHPHLRITAIDISAASLAYAAARAAELNLTRVTFRQHDLHDAASLGRFDLIVSSGVLHHLADPEAGWAALLPALRPGGVMRVMLYSKVARLPIAAARRRLGDLLDQPVTDDLLRAARARLMQGAPPSILASHEFYKLGGLHDLLLHTHEDSFDIPRIRRAIDSLGLDLLGLRLPTAAHRARYRAANAHDRHFRDTEALTRYELAHPSTFGGMYDVWAIQGAG